CFGDLAIGERACMTIPGRALENVVVEQVIRTVAPPAIQLVRTQWACRRRERSRSTRREDQQLLDARAELHRLRKRYLECDDAKVEVRAILEDRLEELATETRRLEALAKNASNLVDDPFTDQAWDELERLCTDLRA